MLSLDRMKNTKVNERFSISQKQVNALNKRHNK